MHYGGEKLGKEWSDFDSQRTLSYFLDFRLRWKERKIATIGGWTDRQTDVTDASEFIICPMLCYSNGTDKNCTRVFNCRLCCVSVGKVIHSMVAHLDAVTSLAIDPSGLYLLSGSEFFYVKIQHISSFITLYLLSSYCNNNKYNMKLWF